jgi:hypothetical protein
MTMKTTVNEIKSLLEKTIVPRLDNMSRKLVEHDARFDRIESRLETFLTKDEAYSHFDRIYKKIESHDQEFVCIKESLKRLESNDQARCSEVRLLDGRVVMLETRVENIEKSIGNIKR